MTDHSLDQFLAACGATEPLRLVVEDSGSATERSFEQPFVLIGRDPRADLRFEEQRVGTRHAYLQHIAGRILFLDFKKKNHSQQAGWLDPGQALEIGTARVRLHECTPAAEWFLAGVKHPYQQNALPVVMLDIVGRGARTSWRMKRPMALIGTSMGCKIRLADDQVSRFHCALVNTPSGLWAVDLLSTNGIAVNGASVRVLQLNQGDELRVGNYTIRPNFEIARSNGRELMPAQAIPASVEPQFSGSAPLVLTPPRSSNVGNNSNAMVASPPTNVRADAELLASPLVIQLTQMQQQMYAQMQQQMAEQFQHAMGLFVDAFWAMYREQSARVHQELKRIRRLTRELAALQAKLEKLSQPGAVPAVESRGALPAQQSISESVETSQSSSPEGKAPAPASEPLTEQKRKPRKPIGPAAPQQSPADLHAWLHNRVHEIQKQRHSSWQRILNLVQGKTPAKPTPSESRKRPDDRHLHDLGTVMSLLRLQILSP